MCGFLGCHRKYRIRAGVEGLSVKRKGKVFGTEPWKKGRAGRNLFSGRSSVYPFSARGDEGWW